MVSFSNSLCPGAAGSCVRVFSTMPFSSCDMNRCLYASRNDKSYWLSTMANVTREPVMGDSIRSLISRCVVCEAPSTPVAMHSQNSIEPECPSNWATLWTGYSFIMVGAEPESSLPFMKPQPVMTSCPFCSIQEQAMKVAGSLSRLQEAV